MKRVFISSVSLQTKSGLQTLIYNPIGIELPRGNVETSFPLVPIVKNYMARPEDVKVILIRDEETATRDNYDAFVEQLQGVGVPATCIQPLEIQSVPSRTECNTMLLKLLDQIDDDSVVYADITYGKKPVSAMMLYAMNLIEKIKDVEVEGIYYGDYVWGHPEDSKLIEVTGLKFMTDIASELEGMKPDDIYSTLKKLGDLDE